MHKLLAACLCLLIGLAQGAYAAEESDWRPVAQTDSQQYVMNILGLSEHDLTLGGNLGSLLQYNVPTSTGYQPKKCNFFGDSVCTKNSVKFLQAGIIYPLCAGEGSNWCINEFSTVDQSGKTLPAKFIRYVDGNTFPSSEEIGLPEGGRISIWRLAYQQESDPIYFAVKVNSWMRWLTEKPFYFQSSGVIYPINLITNPEYKATKFIDLASGIARFRSGLQCDNAIFISDGLCGVLAKFPEDIRLKLSIRVPNEITGFVSTRTRNLNLFSKPLDGSRKLLTIEGEPVRIPRLGLVLSRDQALKINPSLGESKMNWTAFDNSQSGDAFNNVEHLKLWANDRASGASKVWNFATLDSSNSAVSGLDLNGKMRIDYSSKCKILPSEVLGSISTNAMILDPGPPNFVNEEFIYNVAGMHFESDGITPFEGYYSLVISKSLAKCLYSNNGVPKRASVSIFDSESGLKKVTTEVIKELGESYAINIAGFTFSKPVIKVKYEFSQEEKLSVLPTPNEKLNSVGSGVKKNNIKYTTIICAKGKKVKYVTAVIPKCPTGYKKK